MPQLTVTTASINRDGALALTIGQPAVAEAFHKGYQTRALVRGRFKD